MLMYIRKFLEENFRAAAPQVAYKKGSGRHYVIEYYDYYRNHIIVAKNAAAAVSIFKRRLSNDNTINLGCFDHKDPIKIVDIVRVDESERLSKINLSKAIDFATQDMDTLISSLYRKYCIAYSKPPPGIKVLCKACKKVYDTIVTASEALNSGVCGNCQQYTVIVDVDKQLLKSIMGKINANAGVPHIYTTNTIRLLSRTSKRSTRSATDDAKLFMYVDGKPTKVDSTTANTFSAVQFFYIPINRAKDRTKISAEINDIKSFVASIIAEEAAFDRRRTELTNTKALVSEYLRGMPVSLEEYEALRFYFDLGELEYPPNGTVDDYRCRLEYFE